MINLQKTTQTNEQLVDSIIPVIKNNIINIINALDNGKNALADKYLDEINTTIIDFVVGQPVDIFGKNNNEILNNLKTNDHKKHKTTMKDIIKQNKIKHLNNLLNPKN